MARALKKLQAPAGMRERMMDEVRAMPMPPLERASKVGRDIIAENQAWRDRVKRVGGHNTTVTFSPAAWAYVQGQRPAYSRVSELVCDALLNRVEILPGARAALDQLRGQFTTEMTDAQLVSMATRWLVKHLGETSGNSLTI